ncbi:MAG: gliding motility-associated C-terminal domain-containing protein [Bacteroidota bacterium]
MKHIILLGISLLLITCPLFSQGEVDWWYFGSYEGIHFPNGANPIEVTGGQVPFFHFGTTVSDECGDLLFYTGVKTIWNKNHQVLATGYNPTAYYGTIISCPAPGNSQRHYVFFDSTGTLQNNKLKYLMVDMNLNGGLGGVSQSPSTITDQAFCDMAIMIHKNCQDYWMVAHADTANVFYSFLITAGGVQPPVLSQVGIPFNYLSWEQQDLIKFSPDGKRLVYRNAQDENVQLFDFDDATGAITNAISLGNLNSIGFDSMIYDLAFSPDGSKLYVTRQYPTYFFNHPRVFQLDLSLGTVPAILNSEIKVGAVPSMSGNSASTLRLGPDGKLYVNDHRNGVSVHVIHEPNRPGLSCNFQAQYLYNVPALDSVSPTRFPHFPDHYFRQATFEGSIYGVLNSPPQCMSTPIIRSIEGVNCIDSVRWDMGEAGLGPITLDSAAIHHTYSQSGTFAIEALVFRGCVTRPDTLRDTVVIHPQPVLDLGVDTRFCQGQSLDLGATNLGASYFWQDGSQGDSFSVAQTGLYWVEVGNACDTLRDSINVWVDVPYLPDLGADSLLCNGEGVAIQLAPDSATYLWQDGLSDAQRSLSQPGLYWVEATNSCGSWRDSVTIGSLASPSVSLGADTSLCRGDTLWLDATVAQGSYLWQHGPNTAAIPATQDQLYRVTASNRCGSATDELQLSLHDLPNIELGADQALCEGESLKLQASFPQASYLWSNGSTGPSLSIDQSGLYHVAISTACGTVRDSMRLQVDPALVFSLGPDTTLCEGSRLLLDPGIGDATYRWQDGSMDQVYSIEAPGTYRLDLSRGSCEATDEISVAYTALPSLDLGADTSLCEGQLLALDLTKPAVSYRWQDGSTLPTYTITREGVYHLSLSHLCGTVSDSLRVAMIACTCPVFVPSAFTPNEDGFNETFAPVLACQPNQYRLEIFNRWGKAVFATDQPLDSWNGRGEAAHQPEGVYTWVVRYRYEGPGGTVQVVKGGTVVLVR